jgi:hypothetical protein
LVYSDKVETVIEFELDGFHLTNVNAPVPKSKIVGIPRSGRISIAGAPDLVQLSAPIIIPDLANMEIEIIDSEYIDFAEY